MWHGLEKLILARAIPGKSFGTLELLKQAAGSKQHTVAGRDTSLD